MEISKHTKDGALITPYNCETTTKKMMHTKASKKHALDVLNGIFSAQ
jgi:hypothetical protein